MPDGGRLTVRGRGHDFAIFSRAMPPDVFLVTAFVASVFDYPLARLRPRSACLCLVKSVLPLAGYLSFGPGFLIALDEGLGGFVLGVVPPVGLHEDGVDLFEVDGFGLVA